MIPSRLSPTNAPRPRHAAPCPETFPGESSTRCEGLEGHEGPHVAHVTVVWDTNKPTEKNGKA